MSFIPSIGFLIILTYFCQASPVTLKAIDGRSLTATVIGIEGEEVLISRPDGREFRVPLTTLDTTSKALVAAEYAKITEQYEQQKRALEKPDPEYTKADMDNAYYASRNLIKNALKSPSTAKFSNPILDKENTGSTVTNEGRIQSIGFVDAQNSFGATLRDHWKVIVQREGEQWRAVYAILGDEVLIDTRKNHKTEKMHKAESFLGMTKVGMIAVLGQPSKTTKGNNEEDGPYSIYSYSDEKGNETLFTIWDSDGKISSGSYRGTYFQK
jgi:hypothetical protein